MSDQETLKPEPEPEFAEFTNVVHQFDMTEKQDHRWVDRGLKFSCEGAGHPMHQSWKLK